MSTIVNKLGLFLLQCLVAKEGVTGEAAKVAETRFAPVLSLAFKCLDQEYTSVSLNVIELVTHYVACVRQLPLQPSQVDSLLALARVVVRRLEYPQWYSVDHLAVHNSLEEMYNYFRTELGTLLSSLLSIPPLQQDLLLYVCQSFGHIRTAPTCSTPQQKEVALHLFLKLGEICKGSPRPELA